MSADKACLIVADDRSKGSASRSAAMVPDSQ